MKIPRVRMRLIALVVGVVLVAGSTVVVVRSNLEADAGHGFGRALLSLIRYVPQPFPIETSDWSPWVANAWAWRDHVEIRDKHDYLSGLARDEAGNLVIRTEEIHVQCVQYQTGAWAPTAHEELICVRINDGGCLPCPEAELTPEERASAIQLLDQWFKANPHPEVPFFWVASTQSSNDVLKRSHALFGGYVINAATIVGVGLMGWGGLGVCVVIRARRRAKAHQCVKCRYDLRGSLGNCCPECGAERVDRNAGDVSPAPPR